MSIELEDGKWYEAENDDMAYLDLIKKAKPVAEEWTPEVGDEVQCIDHSLHPEYRQLPEITTVLEINPVFSVYGIRLRAPYTNDRTWIHVDNLRLIRKHNAPKVESGLGAQLKVGMWYRFSCYPDFVKFTGNGAEIPDSELSLAEGVLYGQVVEAGPYDNLADARHDWWMRTKMLRSLGEGYKEKPVVEVNRKCACCGGKGKATTLAMYLPLSLGHANPFEPIPVPCPECLGTGECSPARG